MLVSVSKRFPTLRSRTNFIEIITSHGVWELIYYTSILVISTTFRCNFFLGLLGNIFFLLLPGST